MPVTLRPVLRKSMVPDACACAYVDVVPLPAPLVASARGAAWACADIVEALLPRWLQYVKAALHLEADPRHCDLIVKVSTGARACANATATQAQRGLLRPVRRFKSDVPGYAVLERHTTFVS